MKSKGAEIWLVIHFAKGVVLTKVPHCTLVMGMTKRQTTANHHNHPPPNHRKPPKPPGLDHRDS